MGLRARLLLLVLVPTIPALILAIYTNLELRRLGAARVEKDAMKVVQLVAAKESGLIGATRQHLVGLSRFPQARSNDLAAFDVFFAGMAKLYTNYTDFGLIESNGNLVAWSFGRAGRTNLSDRSHVQRVLQTHDLAIGDYQPGEGTNRPSLPIAYPVLDEQGQLARILYATLDLGALNRIVANTTVPEGGVIQVFDRSGHILGGAPEPENWVGKTFSDSPLLSTILTKGEGMAELRGVDGVPRLHAFTATREGREAGLFVSVGIPASVAYGETKHILAVNLAVLVGVAALALWVALIYANRHILHPIAALSGTSRRVAAGDLQARTGILDAPGELNQLARAFDEMTASLQRQRAEINGLNATLERRVAERTAQLESLNKELEAFSYSVSHDLRAPLRHIAAFANLVREEAASSLNEESARHLEIICSVSKRMGQLVDDLLTFSRTGRTEMHLRPVRMDEVVNEVLQEMKRDTENRIIEWNVEPLPQVLSDRSMLKQVWVNLLSNAIKYTRHRDRAEIHIGGQNHEGEFQFWVRDNGAGFDMQYAKKLFGVFERLHQPEEFEGTGIGLANVRRIIARHGGRTWAEGRVGEGAVFYFTLPTKSSSAIP